MKKDLPVEVVYILDRSGSMTSIADDVIGGFNESLSKQKKTDVETNCTVVMFDDNYEIPIYRTPIQNVEDMNDSTFLPRGLTALNDAIGRTLTEFSRMRSEGKVDKAIFVIITDGMENSSTEFDSPSIKKLRENCEEEFGWDFLFLAANQDAFATNANYGFSGSNVANYAANANSVSSAFRGITDKISSYTSNAYDKSLNNADLLKKTRSVNLQDVVIDK